MPPPAWAAAAATRGRAVARGGRARLGHGCTGNKSSALSAHSHPYPVSGVIPFNTPTRAARARTLSSAASPRRARTAESPAMPSQPSQSDAGPGRGRISRLDLVNFKSYGGKTTLGPFLDFSAVVGPNGAGAHRGSRGSRAGRSGEGAPRVPGLPPYHTRPPLRARQVELHGCDQLRRGRAIQGPPWPAAEGSHLPLDDG